MRGLVVVVVVVVSVVVVVGVGVVGVGVSVADGGRDGEKSKGEIGIGGLLLAVGEETTEGGGGEVGRGRE